MNRYRIENPNSNNKLDCKSSSTIRTNPARRSFVQLDEYDIIRHPLVTKIVEAYVKNEKK